LPPTDVLDICWLQKVLRARCNSFWKKFPWKRIEESQELLNIEASSNVSQEVARKDVSRTNAGFSVGITLIKKPSKNWSTSIIGLKGAEFSL
jgi:hypothetical protein